MVINIKNAITGFQKELKHLDNHYVQAKSKGITQPFQVQILKNEGMPIHLYPS